MSSQHRGVVQGRPPRPPAPTDLSTLQALYQPPYSPNGEPSFCFPCKTTPPPQRVRRGSLHVSPPARH